MPMIIICEHCATPTTGKFCSQCKTAQGRRDQDEANNELWMEMFNKPYVCKYCLKKDKEREEKRLERLEMKEEEIKITPLGEENE